MKKPIFTQHYVAKFLLALAIGALPLTSYADDSESDIPVTEDPGNNQGNKHNDYVDPPTCRYNRDNREVYVYFDFYCGNATVTVTSASGMEWTVSSSTMCQPIVCNFGGEPGVYHISITTTTGLAYCGSFIIH